MKVGTILDSIDQGAMALPEFQRGYVWNRNQVRGLVDSMYRGHPVGSLLTWQTRTENAEARGDARLQPGTVQLLLDGQQRITSLYGLIRGTPPPFFDGNERAFTDLRFHLNDEAFEFWQPVKMRDDPLWIDVTEVLRDGTGAIFQRLFADAGGDPDRAEQLQTWIQRVNRIGEIKERDFQIELVTGADKTVDVVVDIFNRVNSGGTKLSKGDLALAKVCAEWPQARDELRGRLAAWREKGYDFKLEWLLRVVNAVVTGRAVFSALADVDADRIRQGLEDAERAINTLLNAISSRLGLDHSRVLPGIYAFPVMARYLADRNFRFADHTERDRLLYWYLHASIRGRFSGSTETVLAQDLLAVTNGAPAEATDRLLTTLRQWRGGELRVIPEDFQQWSVAARFYPVLYMLTRVEGARDWGTGDLLSHHALGWQTNLEIHHIFPKSVLYEAGYARSEVNALANFTFLTGETNREISNRHPLEYVPEYESRQPGAVASHWMPVERELLAIDNYRAFLERRRALLTNAANGFFDELFKGEQLPSSDEVDESEWISQSPMAIEASERTDEEQEQLDELQGWLRELGATSGELDFELTQENGEQLAILDLAFPEGVQLDLSEPVALLLNEPRETLEVASEAGYRVFTEAEPFRRYALALLEGEQVLADLDDAIGIQTPG